MTLTITSEPRSIFGRKTKSLREEGHIPAVLYGFEVEPVSITLNRNELERLYREAGESTVIALVVDGKEHNVLIQEIQRDPVSDLIVHADFRRIDMSQKVEASINISFVGEAAAVKELGGVFMRNLEEVEVLALPSALVREIEIDISPLETFDDALRVKDLKVPAGIEILSDGEMPIASVQAPRTQEEMDALDEAVVEDVESVEVEGETPEDGAPEGEEGEKKDDATKAEEPKEKDKDKDKGKE